MVAFLRRLTCKEYETLRSIDVIQKRLAFFLLVVFALSATPKVFFHEVLAHHKDGLICREHEPNVPCFHRQAFHCQFDDLVVAAPYLSLVQDLAIVRPPFFAQHATACLPAQLTTSSLHTESRGPPFN